MPRLVPAPRPTCPTNLNQASPFLTPRPDSAHSTLTSLCTPTPLLATSLTTPRLTRLPTPLRPDPSPSDFPPLFSSPLRRHTCPSLPLSRRQPYVSQPASNDHPSHLTAPHSTTLSFPARCAPARARPAKPSLRAPVRRPQPEHPNRPPTSCQPKPQLTVRPRPLPHQFRLSSFRPPPAPNRQPCPGHPRPPTAQPGPVRPQSTFPPRPRQPQSDDPRHTVCAPIDSSYLTVPSLTNLAHPAHV